jgi:hypothetical protein
MPSPAASASEKKLWFDIGVDLEIPRFETTQINPQAYIQPLHHVKDTSLRELSRNVLIAGMGMSLWLAAPLLPAKNA